MGAGGTTHGIVDMVAPVAPVIAREFRLECVQASGSALEGPRIIELDGFGTPVDLDACRDKPAGLVHYYSGDHDASDLLGAPSGGFAGQAGIPGRVGGAFEFDGSTSGLQIGNGNNPDLDFGPDASFSFDVWFNRYGTSPSGQQGQSLIMLNYDCSPTLQGMVVQNTGRLFFQSRDQNGGTSYVMSPGLIPAQEWHHAVGVREVTNGVRTLRLYLDGELVDMVHDQSTGVLASGASDWIGRRNWCGDFNFFFGAMDEIGIYRRALTSDEVLQRYAAGVAGLCTSCAPEPPGLVAHWQGEGDANDAVGGLNGVPSGGVTYVPGQVGEAFQFDGLDGAVTVASSPVLSPHTGSQGAMSLMAWVFVDNYPAVDPLTQQSRRSFMAQGDLGRYEYALSIFTNGAVQFSVWGPAGNTYSEPAGGQLPLRGWHHVAGTLVKGQGARVFLDGVLVGEDIARGDTAAGTAPLVLGRRADGSFFAGGVDDVLLFDRALTPEEVLAIAQAGAAGICAPGAAPAAPPPVITAIRVEDPGILPAEPVEGPSSGEVVVQWTGGTDLGLRIEMSHDLMHWVEVSFVRSTLAGGIQEARVALPARSTDLATRFFRLRQ
jgi:hypothetical protein